ncbi:DUF3576 domain-containing protein [bacterium]|nr:DUF3576 domain-containing protein [bacterium]
MRRSRTASASFVLLAASLALGACSSWGAKTDSYEEQQRAKEYKFGSLFGAEGGINLFGGNKSKADEGAGLGVNAFLWRASLDTLSFMPIASADPFGGVILTDWYTPPEAPGERFKVNLYILDKQLRADGLRVAVFRQVRTGADWREAAVAPDTARQLEDAVLTRARQLRVSQAPAK